jgi:hypothetical protein
VTDLARAALDLARDILADGQLLPFALVEGPDGLKKLTIVTPRSDMAMILGRRLIKAEVSAERYAICADAFLRIAGERRDAVLIEDGNRGDRTALVVGHPYSGAVFDTAVDLERRPSAMHDWDPLDFDWGAASVDIYNEERKLAVHIVNHELATAEQLARSVRFVRARIRHHTRCLPQGTSHIVHVEDRDRVVDKAELRAGIGGTAQVMFASERG